MGECLFWYWPTRVVPDQTVVVVFKGLGLLCFEGLQCFDAVGWAAGRASVL